VNVVMNPLGFMSGYTTGGILNSAQLHRVSYLEI
jgi:hypothetical protein